MKHSSIVLLETLTCAGLIVFSNNLYAIGSWTIDGVTWSWYNYTKETAGICGADPAIGNLVVPATVSDGTYPVTAIGNEVFENCTGLTSIIIPESIKWIWDRSFYGCAGLTSMIIPDSVMIVGDEAFKNCTGLQNVKIGGGATSIKSFAFENCTSLTNVIIEKGVNAIGYKAFLNCNAALFDTNSIPGVKLVDGWAVGYTSLLSEHLNLSGVRGIGDCAFEDCTNLLSVVIPNGVMSIASNAFSNCANLLRVTIPNSVTNICDGAFRDCKRLTSVKIPDNVMSIESYAFQNCLDLTSVTIGNSVKRIGYKAFENCISLASVTIPESTTIIGTRVFGNCSNMDSVIFRGSPPNKGRTVAPFISVKSGCIAYVNNSSRGWPEEGKTYWGLVVKHYGCAVNDGTISESDGLYSVVADTGKTLTESDFAFTTVVNGELIDTSKGYDIVVSDDGSSAMVMLKPPIINVATIGDDIVKDTDDSSGVLVICDDSKISAKPASNDGEVVGALPVNAYEGLFYQAGWGNDLNNLIYGDKVQAVGGSLYLGVIKQSGERGFYKVTVSEK